jgi:signal transduction histidine kinase
MDRTTTTRDAAFMAATVASPPRRRWSDGPNYPWTSAAEDDWSVATQWPALVAVLCEDVSGGTNDLAREIERLRTEGKLARADVQAMYGSLVAMRSTGLALQQIVRLGAGLFNLSPDRVDLGELARAVVRERQRELLRRRVEVSLQLGRAEVWVDAAIASGLMQAGLDWAVSFSRKVRVKLAPGEGDAPARLVIRGALPQPSQEPHGANRRMNDNLHWVLLRQLAARARLPIGRSSSAATESALIDFPATIKNNARSGREG